MRLPGEVVALHLDRQRVAVGVFGGVALAGSVVHPADLVPGSGDRAGLAQGLEAVAGFGMRDQRICKEALLQPDSAQLALVDSD